VGKRIGVWIDHSKAYVIEARSEEEAELTATIESEARPVSKTTGHVANVPRGGVANSVQTHAERGRDQDLKKFYSRVIDAVNGAAEILIAGPGLAKKELLREIEDRNGMVKRVRDVQTMDHPTMNQLRAHVRAYFFPARG